MSVRYIDVTKPSAMKDEARAIARAQLRRIFGIAFAFLVLHLAFAGLTLYNEYVLGEWTIFLPLTHGDYFHFVWWYFVYLPLIVFVYGLFELWPYVRLYRDRKTLEDATIIVMPRRVNTLFTIHAAGVLLFILVTGLTLTSHDIFSSQLLLLICWGSYAKIGALIGSRI